MFRFAPCIYFIPNVLTKKILKHPLIILATLLFTLSAVQCSANPFIAKDSMFINLNDTSFHDITLTLDTSDEQTVYLHTGQALIYFSLDELIDICVKGREIASKVNRFKTKKNASEIPERVSTHWEFEAVADYLLERGRTAVLDLNTQRFVSKISYRLETFDGRAERFYFMPGYRIFFSVVKLSEIDDKKWFPKNKTKKATYELSDRTAE